MQKILIFRKIHYFCDDNEALNSKRFTTLYDRENNLPISSNVAVVSFSRFKVFFNFL